MVATTLSICLGSFLTLACGVSLTLNLTVLFVLVKGKFLLSTHSSVYILAFANICGNSFQMALYTFYMGPSCILQDFLYPGGKKNFFTGFMGYLFHGQWLQDLFIQDATSFNRMITVVYPKATSFFSRKKTIGIAFLVYFSGFFVAWIANYVMPCCQFYLYYDSYSYAFLDTDYNVANIFIDTPINIITSVIAVLNYVIIYTFVHMSNKKITKVMEKSIQQSRKSQEMKYVFQFAFCTLCCIMTWISFRIFSAIVPKSSPYLILTILQVFHSSANSMVFLIFNKDVRQQFKYHVLGKKLEKTFTVTVLPSVTNARKTTRITA